MKTNSYLDSRRTSWEEGREFITDCGLPKQTTLVKFRGYDHTLTRQDPKGVLRVEVQRSSEDRYGFKNLVGIAKNKTNVLEKEEENVVRIPRSSLDSEIAYLGIKLKEEKRKTSEFDCNNPLFIYNPKVSKRERLDLLLHLRRQVDESLERPDVLREHAGTLMGKYEFDGFSYKIDRADKLEDWGKNTTIPMLQSSVEYVLETDFLSDRKILAHRFGSDKRVCVEGSFQGDVRKMQNYEPTKFSQEQKRSLMHLFRTLHPEIEEVAFIDGERVRTD